MATGHHAKGANAATADVGAHAVASVLHKCRLAKQTHQQMKRFTPLKQTSMQHNASKMVNPCRHKASAAMNAASAVVASVPGVSAKPEQVCDRPNDDVTHRFAQEPCECGGEQKHPGDGQQANFQVAGLNGRHARLRVPAAQAATMADSDSIASACSASPAGWLP